MTYPKKLAAVTAVLAALLLTPAAFPQRGRGVKEPPSPANASTGDDALKKAACKGLPVTATINVADEASVEAVLIPAHVARRIFGHEVASNYAVVEVIISNKDSKAALIVQSIFLDDSKWILSGIASDPSPWNSLGPTQKANLPWQVASLESRLIRGELLDAQQWTKRNWTIRSLTAVGSIAAGFQFPFSGAVGKGIAAFNGEVVPGASILWPDGTVNQINRITDFGFQTNKIVPKEASETLVAFFPIERFLTSTFRQWFLKNPAGFFAPVELLADPKTAPDVLKVVDPIAEQLGLHLTKDNIVAQVGRALLAKGCDATPPPSGSTDTLPLDQCALQELLTRLSLNSVRIVVGGVMSVDVKAVPATIYQVTFKDNGDPAGVWTKRGSYDGTISGVYLRGGIPSVVDEDGKPVDGIGKLTVNADDSSDSELDFTMPVTQCVTHPKNVYFVVTKSATDDASASKAAKAGSHGKSAGGVVSSPFLFSIPNYSCPAPE